MESRDCRGAEQKAVRVLRRQGGSEIHFNTERMNIQIESLHAAFCASAGIELRMNSVFERWWYEALKFNPDLTTDCVRLVVKYRMRLNREQRGNWSLQLSRLIDGEDRLAVFEEHLAAARAELRRPVMDPGKADVMRATGRPIETEKPARMAKEAIINGLEALKKSMN